MIIESQRVKTVVTTYDQNYSQNYSQNHSQNKYIVTNVVLNGNSPIKLHFDIQLHLFFHCIFLLSFYVYSVDLLVSSLEWINFSLTFFYILFILLSHILSAINHLSNLIPFVTQTYRKMCWNEPSSWTTKDILGLFVYR